MDPIQNEEQLENLLSEPSERDCQAMARTAGDILVLGAGGKMGPSLCRRIKRASDAVGKARRVIAVSRFGSPGPAESLRESGVEVQEADLIDHKAFSLLPDAENVVFMAGRKFGSADRPDLTWAINTLVPGYAAERFRSSRIVVFSTGNLYPFVAASSGGSRETDPTEPHGEYAQSCLGRERLFEHFSLKEGTPCLFFRLNYAVDLRYGVLVDIAWKVRRGEPIELRTASFNVIWQGDANSYALRCLEHCSSPPRILNVTGPETISVRMAAEFFGRIFGLQPTLTGEESETALLSNASDCHALLGYPEVPLGILMEWVANWVTLGGPLLNKPTHFEVKDGKY